MPTSRAAWLVWITLTGPWRFHTGDDPRWSRPAFDDAAWETVDLSAPPGAHDSDVGITAYVPGWTAHGHADYAGYAWYRLRVPRPPGDTLVLLGPAAVDDAYELFVNGVYLGSNGAFVGPTPVVHSMHPRRFAIPPSLAHDSVLVIAVRVWMSPETLAGGGDVGGIHVAPELGEARAIDAHYRQRWREVFYGYVVDLIEPIAFLLLALMARTQPWLAAALVLTALTRVNNALFAWGQFETPSDYDLVRVVLVPLTLAAWTIAWRTRLGIRARRWIPLTLAIALIAANAWHQDSIAGYLRLSFAALILQTAWLTARRRHWLALAIVFLIALGLFAPEFSSLGIPGIWFPFGIGVSRTQFAYAAATPLLVALVTGRSVANA
jgi:hypothetical protein